MEQAHLKGLYRHLVMEMERIKKMTRLTLQVKQDLPRPNPRRERTLGFLALLGCRLPNKEEWPGSISMRSWKSSNRRIRVKARSPAGSPSCWKCKYIISQHHHYFYLYQFSVKISEVSLNVDTLIGTKVDCKVAAMIFAEVLILEKVELLAEKTNT